MSCGVGFKSLTTSACQRQSGTLLDRAACRTAAAASNYTVQPGWCNTQHHARLLNPCYSSRHSGARSRGVAHSACSDSQHHVCFAASEHREQQLWLPQQHHSLMQQLQEPAQQVQNALDASRPPATKQKYAACTGRSTPSRQFVVAAAAASRQVPGDADGPADPGSNGSSSGSTNKNSSSSGSSLSSVMRERMRERVATRLTKSTSPEQSVPQTEAAPAAQPPPPDALAASIAQAAAAANNRGGQHPPPVRSNDSSIGDILQQLQQKLGPQYSKPGGVAQLRPATATSSSNSIGSSADTPRATPAVDSTADAGAGVAASSAASSRRRVRQQQHQQQLLLKQQSKRSKQQQRASVKEQKAAAFQQLQAAADVLLQHRPSSASASSSRATEQSSSSSSRVRQKSQGSTLTSTSNSKQLRPPAQPRTRRRTRDSIITAAATAQGAAAAQAAGGFMEPTGAVSWHDDLGPLPPGVAAVVAGTAAPVEVQRQLLRSVVAGHGVPSNSHILARRLMHFDQASQLLGGPERAASILERDSSLLLMAPAVLQRKLKHLQELLASSAPLGAAADVSVSASSTREAAELADAAAAGRTAGSSSGDSAYRVSGEVLGLLRSHPGLLRLSAAGLAQRLASLQATLGLASKQEVLQVVRWQPRVLCMSEAALQDKVWGLAAVLRVPPANIQSLFVRQPLLLNLSSDTLSRKASSLHSSLGLAPQQLWEMLHCKPGVLLFSSAKVARKWTALQQIAASHPRWLAELAELSPGSLVQLLTASDPRLARLQHVAAVGLQEEQSMYYTAAEQTDARFRARFRQYGRWLVEQNRRGAAAAGGLGAGGGHSA